MERIVYDALKGVVYSIDNIAVKNNFQEKQRGLDQLHQACES